MRSDAAGSAQINVLYCDPSGPQPAGCDNFPAYDNAESVFVNAEDSTGANFDEPFVVTLIP